MVSIGNAHVDLIADGLSGCINRPKRALTACEAVARSVGAETVGLGCATKLALESGGDPQVHAVLRIPL